MKRKIILILCILLATGSILGGCTLDQQGEDTKPSETDKDVLNKQLIKAVENKDAKLIESIIKEGADVNTKDPNGRTPTMIATYNNDIPSANVLINAGADVNIQDNTRNNPFLYAGAEGYLEILRLTIKAGADPRLTNRYGGTALIPASEHGYVDVVAELLTKTDINVNHINDLGWTALLEAIILNNGDLEQQQTVQLLIDHGADVNIKDKNGVSPLAHARRMGFVEIENILLKAGAK